MYTNLRLQFGTKSRRSVCNVWLYQTIETLSLDSKSIRRMKNINNTYSQSSDFTTMITTRTDSIERHLVSVTCIITEDSTTSDLCPFTDVYYVFITPRIQDGIRCMKAILRTNNNNNTNPKQLSKKQLILPQKRWPQLVFMPKRGSEIQIGHSCSFTAWSCLAVCCCCGCSIIRKCQLCMCNRNVYRPQSLLTKNLSTKDRKCVKLTADFYGMKCHVGQIVR